MQRFNATARFEQHGGDNSLSGLVQSSYENKTSIFITAERETVEIPLELMVNGYSRHRDRLGRSILEFSGVTITAVKKAFEATSFEPNPLTDTFALDIDERSDDRA